uniref:Uncharacterized protein n=1 Tax=Arundo donax TaxID=35708 RepID=A0A0A9AAI8_ARUDO
MPRGRAFHLTRPHIQANVHLQLCSN